GGATAAFGLVDESNAATFWGLLRPGDHTLFPANNAEEAAQLIIIWRRSIDHPLLCPFERL
ncbi:MAG: hypothetical protein P8J33_11430, partial [Pirellulaceae bacterium]|nr:hypothetical protein [Pirellulaceae bacterium]